MLTGPGQIDKQTKRNIHTHTHVGREKRGCGPLDLPLSSIQNIQRTNLFPLFFLGGDLGLLGLNASATARVISRR